VALKNIVEIILRGRDEVSGTFKKVGAEATGFQRTMAGIGAFMRSPLGLIGGFTGAAFAVDRFVDGFVNAGNRMWDLSKRFQLPVEFLSEMEYAAKQSGVALEELATGFQFLQRNMENAASGEKAQAELFQRLGIQVTDATGKVRAIDEMLPELADKFAALSKEGRGASEAMQVFGRGGGAMLQFMRDGSEEIEKLREEGRKAGLITTEMAKAADIYADSLVRMGRVMQDVRNRIMAPMIKQFNELFGLMTQSREINKMPLEEILGMSEKEVDSIFNSVTRAWVKSLRLMAEQSKGAFVPRFQPGLLEAGYTEAELALQKKANENPIVVPVVLKPVQEIMKMAGGKETTLEGDVRWRGETIAQMREQDDLMRKMFEWTVGAIEPQIKLAELTEKELENYKALGEAFGIVIEMSTKSTEEQLEAFNKLSVNTAVVQGSVDLVANSMTLFTDTMIEAGDVSKIKFGDVFQNVMKGVIASINQAIARMIVLNTIGAIFPGLGSIMKGMFGLGRAMPGVGRGAATTGSGARAIAFDSNLQRELRRAQQFSGVR